MARIRYWKKGCPLFVALAPLVAACASGCTDQTTAASKPGPPDDGGAGADDVSEAVSKMPGGEVLDRGADGLPTFVRADFGRLPAGNGARAGAAVPSLTPIAPLYRLQPADLRFERATTDALGYRHFRYRQQIDGEEVIGSEVVVHVDATGLVYATHGNARRGAPVPDALLRRADAVDLGPGYAAAVSSAPELAYVLSSRDGKVYRAWSVVADGERDGDPYQDRVFVDAVSGRVVDVHPLIHTAISRKIYSGGNTSALPGTLVRAEGQAPVGDGVVNGNYDHLGDVYACYQQLFDRDSYDGSGAALVSTVHHRQNYTNAFWNGVQMVYGDGDGVKAAPLALSFDITAHELTHGVTLSESSLIYVGEPGAINEGMSDIFAAVCKAFVDGGVVSADTWKIGEDVWTPATPGDALRYMDDPTKDVGSRDYYPERYTGFEDYGGVHRNSGIANHAFYLLAVGGQHVRGKTPGVTVPALGIDRAAQIWYRANTTYLSVFSGFKALRTALRQAAHDLYGADAAAAADKSMDAVGAPGSPPPASCVGRCGEFDPALSCQCDDACAEYGDCCPDLAEACQ